MWCRNVRNQLSAFVDGELSSVEARLVSEHLAHCPHCEREHSSLKQLVGLTASIPMEEVSTTLHGRIMMRLAYADSAPVVRRARPRPGFGTSLWGWAGFAAAAAVAFGITRTQTVPPTPRLASPESVQASSGDLRSTPDLPRTSDRRRDVQGIPVPMRVADRKTEADASVQATKATRVAEAQTSAPSESVARRPARGLRAETPVRVPERVTDEIRPQPVAAVPPGGKSVLDPKPSEPGEMMAMEKPDAMTTTPPAAPGSDESMMPATAEKEPTRMAGMTLDADPVIDEDEGVRPLKMFLEERNRTVPQPPVAPNRDRKSRKSL